MVVLAVPHSGKRLYRLAVGSFFFVQGTVFASWASRIPDIMQRHGLNEAELGAVLFSMPVGQMLCMGLSGWLVSHIGSRKTLLSGVTFYLLTLMGLGYAPSTLSLCALLMLFGVGSSLCNIAVNTQAVGVERLYHRSIMAAFHGLWSLAGFIGGVIGALFAGFGVAPGPHFLCIGVACFCLVLRMQRAILPRDHRVHASSPSLLSLPTGFFARLGARLLGRLRRVNDPVILILGLVAFGCMSAEGAMFDWSSVYYEVVIHPSPELVRVGYITFMCTMVCGRFMADGMVTRFGAVRVLQTSGVLIAVGLLIAVLFPTVAPATAGLALVGFGTASVVPLCYSLAGKATHMHPGVAVTVVSSIGFMGFLLCPPVIGVVAQLTSLRWSFALMALFGFLTAVVAPRLGRKTG